MKYPFYLLKDEIPDSNLSRITVRERLELRYIRIIRYLSHQSHYKGRIEK